jgi:phage terminase large subunit
VPATDLGYRARDQFAPFHKRAQRWAVMVAHRRAGKTVASVMDLVDAALRCTKPDPRFAYVAPTYTQAKDVAWEYLKRYTAPILGTQHNESELRVDLPNRARVRLYGADNYDRMRGVYFDGVVLDEYSDMDPRAWSEVIRPALSDRKGWGVFIATPKGHNDFHKIWDKTSRNDPDWYRLMLRASETGLLDADELADARKAMSAEQFAQEYECSFEAAVVGAYYGNLMADAERDKRIGGVPYDPAVRVWTAWDLGIGDPTAIWFAQMVGREVHLIDYYEATGMDLGHYVKVLDQKPYLYAGHILPHDVEAKELGTGKTRKEVLESLGLEVEVAKAHGVDDGINAVRVLLPRCWFDLTKCERGVEALRLYRAEFDEKLKTVRPRPLHDWTSHAADAFRYLAMALDDVAIMPSGKLPQIESSWVR